VDMCGEGGATGSMPAETQCEPQPRWSAEPAKQSRSSPALEFLEDFFGADNRGCLLCTSQDEGSDQ
jgi:hypothetical protein